jgi:hypothetical protein
MSPTRALVARFESERLIRKKTTLDTITPQKPHFFQWNKAITQTKWANKKTRRTGECPLGDSKNPWKIKKLHVKYVIALPKLEMSNKLIHTVKNQGLFLSVISVSPSLSAMLIPCLYSTPTGKMRHIMTSFHPALANPGSSSDVWLNITGMMAHMGRIIQVEARYDLNT